MSRRKKVTCPKCGVQTFNLSRHEGTRICEARRHGKELESKGYHKCLGTNSIIKRAGIDVIYATVDSGPNIANAYYAPKWAVAVALHRNLHPEERVRALKSVVVRNRQSSIDTLLRISGIDLEWWAAVQEFHYTDVKSERAPINKITATGARPRSQAAQERRDVMTSIIQIALEKEEQDDG